jgi:N-methylhydantoinase A
VASPSGEILSVLPLTTTGSLSEAAVCLATDIGGTFTDVASFDPSTSLLRFGKTLTTPRSLVEGIEAGIEKAQTRFSEASLFLHGTTVAINAMLERTGASTALITTQGFRDVYEIGRVNRPDSYNLFFSKHVPLVPRYHRYEVAERLSASGEILTALDEDALRKLASHLRKQNIEAVAILFLHCYRNPDHERRAKAILQEELPDHFISASHELSQEYREFERCSTVVANAYVGPRVRRYLEEIERRIANNGFRGNFLVVQSTGGLLSVGRAKAECIRMLESGPAAGVIGTQAVAQSLGLKNAIAFDMGGTTAKAGVIFHGQPLTTGSALVGGYEKALPVQIPMMDIFEVGTGGGSIARVEHGALLVGPQSAGAEPGPACYGRGGVDPTVTDANLVLGRLSAARFLGGEMPLDVAAATKTVRERVAAPLGLDVIAAADGILRIATTKMSYAVKAVTTARGLDVGDFALVAYGGAGPLHATAIAREIGVRRVIIPHAPGHFSAFGMLFSDLRYDFVRTWFADLRSAPFDTLDGIFAELERQGREAIATAAFPPKAVLVQRSMDMRYVGQEHVVTVDIALEHFASRDREAIKRVFDEEHQRRYAISAPEEPVEIASLRATVTGVTHKPPLKAIQRGAAEAPDDAHTDDREVYFTSLGEFRSVPTFSRVLLLAGNRIMGPAIIEEHASTTVLMPNDALQVDAFGNLDIRVGATP